MRRREFLGVLGGAAAWPLTARAQQADQMRRIGVLTFFAESDPEGQRYISEFVQRLRQSGWVAGRNVQMEYRWAGVDPDRIRADAAELVGLRPDLILTSGTPATAAVLRLTRTIPIVFTVVSDPIGNGFVANLPRPGGNVTGFTNFESTMGGKWLELLKEIAPGVSQASAMFNPQTAPFAQYYLPAIELAARSSAVELSAAAVRNAAEIESTLTALGGQQGGGLIVMPDATMQANRGLIILLAARFRIPVVYPYRYMAAEGGLISYGLDQADMFRGAASYVDRVLKGGKPADLPVQAPTKFELVVNLKTARALGLTVPLTLQASASEVIE